MTKGGNIARVAGRRLDKPRIRVVWKTWPVYVALYKDRKGNQVIVKGFGEPEEVRKFKVQGGIRNFKLVKYKRSLQEVPIVARSTKKAPAKKRGRKNTVVTDDEIDELESVDELEEEDEDLEDEDEELEDDEDEEDEEEDEDDEPEDEDEDDEEEDDDEDDEEDEEPPKRSRKSGVSRAAADGMIGTNEIAKKAGVDSRTLRMVLRKHKVKKDPETRRYQWKSWKDKTVVKILAWLEEGEAADMKKESLDRLKEQQDAKRAAAKKSSGKKTSKKAPAKKKRRRAEEDEDDE